MFKYREKRFGKFSLILFALITLAIAGACVFGGVYAVLHMTSWVKYLLVVLGLIVGLILAIFGILMLIITFSFTGKDQSVRDGNSAIGIADTRLCDKCGRVISKDAVVCEHCGAKQKSDKEKVCPECKTKNNGTAEFCKHCGHKFE